MVGLPWSQHVAFLDDRAAEAGDPAARSPRRSPSSAIIRPSWPSRSATRFRRASSAGTAACASSASCGACIRTPRPRRPTACSPTSTFRRPSFSISRSSTSARSTSTCTASRAARVSRAAAAHRRPQAAAARRGGRRQHPRRRSGPGRHHGDAHPRGLRGRRLRRDRVRVDRRVVARRPSGRRLGVRPRRSRAPPEAGGRGRRGGVRRRAVSREARRAWPRVSVVVCAYNAADTLEDCLVARAADLSGLRDHPRQRRLARSHGRDRPRPSARARHRHPERRPERGAQRRPRRKRPATSSPTPTPTRASTATGSRFSSSRSSPRTSSAPADRTSCRADDPPMAQCIARAPGRPDARAARRSHRRARARLQHGVPPRRAARDRRLQPDLPPRRRRCGCVLAAAGARLEDRLRVVGARLASPPLVGEGVLAPAGRLRRRRDVADGAPSGQISRRPHAVARPHLQPAALRAVALGHAHQRRRLGHRGVPVGLPHRRPSVRVPAALDQVAGRLVRADDRRPRRRRHGTVTTGRPPCCSAPAWSASPRRWRRTSPTRCDPTWTRFGGSRLWYRATVAYLHFIQPLARLRGRIRGVLSPPEVAPAAERAADEPRSPALARRGVARAAADLRQRHRGSLLERDVDVGRSRAHPAHRLAAALARGAHD